MDTISVTQFLRHYPNYKAMHQDIEWSVENVGSAYDYDDSVRECGLYAYYGIFMKLFIRKCVCRRFCIPCDDDCTNNLLEEFDLHDRDIEQEIAEGYEVYIDHESRPIDEIYSIKMVALSHKLIYEGVMEDFDDVNDMSFNLSNLKDVVVFLNKLPYGQVSYDESLEIDCGSITMEGAVDFIFDEHVFCQIATSWKSDVYKKKYAQVLLYILCHYGENYYAHKQDQEYTIKIYNPLLGEIYKADIVITPRTFINLYTKISRDIKDIC